MKKDKKGYTLIELLLSISLCGIIIALIVNFLIFNIKSYNNIYNKTELQHQGNYMLNFMSKKIMESNNMSYVKYNDTTSYGLSSLRIPGVYMKVNQLSFKYGTEISENYVFYLNYNTLWYGKGLKDIKPTVELGSYVDEMYIKLFRNESLGLAKALTIKLVLKKDGQTFEAEQSVYMRN